MIAVREVAHGSADYRLTVELRREVLRIPLGLDFSEDELARESREIHLAAFEGERVVGCLVLSPVGDTEIKMRQVSVAPDRRGQGIGRQLVQASEELARKRGFTEMTLHARDTAAPFYLGLDYAVVGEPFVEVSIPHRRMVKKFDTSG